MKATNLDTGEHGERFVIYMYVTRSDDSGIDTAEEGISSDTTRESEAFHWIDCIEFIWLLRRNNSLMF